MVTIMKCFCYKEYDEVKEKYGISRWNVLTNWGPRFANIGITLVIIMWDICKYWHNLSHFNENIHQYWHKHI